MWVNGWGSVGCWLVNLFFVGCWLVVGIIVMIVRGCGIGFVMLVCVGYWYCWIGCVFC